MAKLGDVIKGKINALVKQAQLSTDAYNKDQGVISAAITVEEARMKSMEAYLDQDLEAVKKEFSSIFDIYSADAPRVFAEPAKALVDPGFSNQKAFADPGSPIKG